LLGRGVLSDVIKHLPDDLGAMIQAARALKKCRLLLLQDQHFLAFGAIMIFCFIIYRGIKNKISYGWHTMPD
jgi:hypothetical protein